MECLVISVGVLNMFAEIIGKKKPCVSYMFTKSMLLGYMFTKYRMNTTGAHGNQAEQNHRSSVHH